MTTREIICDAFDSTVDGIAKRCQLDGDRKAAAEIASEVFDLANGLVSAVSDDGKVDETEKQAIKAKFRDTIAKRVPEVSFWFLGTVWEIVRRWLRNIHEKMSAKISKED